MATSIHTSFVQLFGQRCNDVEIRAIEIPLIQRDYAQGRKTERVRLIRDRFVADLCEALEDRHIIDLDFVFGDVKPEDGTFYPLDGQQRLTTLYLLHCYLAWHVAAPDKQPWHSFSYATRPGARAFCQFLVADKSTGRRPCPELTHPTLSAWLTDQADYLPTWKHDPTIQSMLVVLDAIHDHYIDKSEKAQQAWARLTDAEQPAIQFHLLPMKANGLTEKLYIKMNSRGKPLTDFENFKAQFEEMLRKNARIALEKVEEFARKVDTDWADVFWPYRGDNALIDEEFMRYFRFVTEVLAWRNDIAFGANDSVESLAERVFGSENLQASAHLDWLMQALDVWSAPDDTGKLWPKNIKAEFGGIFSRTDTPDLNLLRVFNFRDFDQDKFGVDMFHACCELYGQRAWRLPHTLQLYGVLLGLIAETPQTDFMRRLRLLRNLIEASNDEIRAGERNNMPKLLHEVEQVMLHENLGELTTFNQEHVANELVKRDFLQVHPQLLNDLYKLEDHPLLRGGLWVFDLDPAQLPELFLQRAKQFPILFREPYQDICGAFLAKGVYGRWVDRGSGYSQLDLGSPVNDEPWTELFLGKKADKGLHPAKVPLMDLLDDLVRGATLHSAMTVLASNTTTPKDWRYYLVKYPTMREGKSGRYIFSQARYEACMLDVWRLTSNYRDPYLQALLQQARLAEGSVESVRYTGYASTPRYLTFKESGLKIRSAEAGWEFDATALSTTQRTVYDSIAATWGFESGLYAVPQTGGIDTCDRIEQGALALQALVSGGIAL